MSTAKELAERWQDIHTEESYGAQGKNLGILARAYLALEAERDSAQIRWAASERERRQWRDLLDRCKTAAVRVPWWEQGSWNGDLIGTATAVSNTLREAQDMIEERDSRIARLEEALREYDAWATRMPDAGFNDASPRWAWWHERPFEHARSVLAADQKEQTEENTSTTQA